MTGRTCQFCGKALSRFSVGSGGDFCSREHRNQFRLRSGMDRLMEANKVANLMRRRENAKSIPAAQLARDCKVLPRVAPLLRIPVRQPDAVNMRPTVISLEKPRIVSRTASPSTASPAAAPMRATVRSIDSEPFPVRRPRPMSSPTALRFNTQLLPAGMAAPRLTSARLAEFRREVMELRLTLRRTNIGGNGIQLRPLNAAPRNCQEPQRPRRLVSSADRGRDLRVSGGIGFRLPKPVIRSLEFARPVTASPGPSNGARALSMVSKPRNSAVAVADAAHFPVRAPSSPPAPTRDMATQLQWPQVLVGNSQEPRQPADSEARTCAMKWTAPGANPPQLQRRHVVVRLRLETPGATSVAAPPPRHLKSTQRLTLVAFQPQEIPFEWSPTALHGTLAGSTHFGVTPLRKIEPQPAVLDEHFDAGLQNWQGGTADWKVDVAGVRPGSLALYYPSLGLPNYLLEFLTRIESKSVTWVVRAANLSDYYQATLAVLPGGAYEFRRCAVIGGLAEGATVRTIPAPSPAPTGKTAVTIRTRVLGNEFTVSLDGQAIETWTDTRLIEGGIGFAGAPEERTRLYWVKVTPIGQHSKEYSKR